MSVPIPMSEVEWMRGLNAELWPEEQRRGLVKCEASRRLTLEEWRRVRAAVRDHRLVVSMCRTNMFGGVGATFHEHPPAPGLNEAEMVLFLVEGHLPFHHGEATNGCCDREAHAAFYEMADTEDNRRWIGQYGLNEPRGASRYDY